MSKFNFKSAICTDRNQSERLLALGLKRETADMCWQTTTLNGEPITYPSQDVWMNGSIITNNHFPAWSLHRILSLIPKEFKVNVIPMCGRNYEMPIEMHILPDLSIVYTDLSKEDYKGFYYTNIYDSLISCIEWQIEQGYFNKEYLV